MLKIMKLDSRMTPMTEEDAPAWYHCPDTFCSAISAVWEVTPMGSVKLRCSLRHTFWPTPDKLRRVYPYWPDEKDRREYAQAYRDELIDDSAPATAIAPWTGPKRDDDRSRDNLD